jgi:hypothetical protein
MEQLTDIRKELTELSTLLPEYLNKCIYGAIWLFHIVPTVLTCSQEEAGVATYRLPRGKPYPAGYFGSIGRTPFENKAGTNQWL